mmetsp:Transcript_95046/g.167858  ORF Transcript_95046/g.167858 Transcript_95046/m.167858 type:complete len:216 (+) Transcript_95046:81-728(+)
MIAKLLFIAATVCLGFRLERPSVASEACDRQGARCGRMASGEPTWSQQPPDEIVSLLQVTQNLADLRREEVRLKEGERQKLTGADLGEPGRQAVALGEGEHQLHMTSSVSQSLPKEALRAAGAGELQPTSEQFTFLGMGQCTDEDGDFVNIGWAPCVFEPGQCDSLDVCKAECAANPFCGAINYYSSHCWMFAKAEKPYVKYNDGFDWHECYIRG